MSENEYNILIKEIRKLARMQQNTLIICEFDFSLSDDLFILEFINQADWKSISLCGHILSEFFIEKFQDKLHWKYISKNCKLSEKLIEKCQKNIHWHRIIYNRNAQISYGFLLEQYLYNYETIFRILRNKDGLIRYANKIEREISTLLLEID